MKQLTFFLTLLILTGCGESFTVADEDGIGGVPSSDDDSSMGGSDATGGKDPGTGGKNATGGSDATGGVDGGTGGSTGGSTGGTGGVSTGGSGGTGGSPAVCTPADVQCSGKTRQTCTEAGQWADTQVCEFACDMGQCVGVCNPGSKRCSASGDAQVCDEYGRWQTTQDCTAACSNGDCVGSCVPGEVSCSGDIPQTCNGSGQWVSGSACQFVCSAGSCTGVCEPGETSCSGLVPRTCNAQGQWVNGSACSFVCSAGSCEGSCFPEEISCSGDTTRTCDSSGQWVNGTTCGAGLCSAGSCMACSPGSTRCNGSGVQSCNGSGQWGTTTACQAYAHETATCVDDGLCEGTCNAGWGDVNGVVEDGCEADVYNDAENCGEPEHSCFGGTCSVGVCSSPGIEEVVEISTASYAYPTAIAEEAGYLYTITSGGYILKVASSGAASPTVLASGYNPKYQNNLIVENGEIFWVSDNFYGQAAGLYKMSVSGGTPVKLSTATPRRFDVENGNVYWLDGFLNSTELCKTGSCLTKFWKVATTGGSTTSPFTFPSMNGGYHAEIKVTATSAYVTKVPYQTSYSTFYWIAVQEVSLTDGSTIRTMTGTTSSQGMSHSFGGLAFNGTHLFYASVVDNDASSTMDMASALRKASLTAATPYSSNVHLNYEPSSLTGDVQAFDIEADADNVYYKRGNRLSRVGVNGGTGDYLTPSSNENRVGDVVLDAGYVYWTASDTVNSKAFIFRKVK